VAANPDAGASVTGSAWSGVSLLRAASSPKRLLNSGFVEAALYLGDHHA